MTWAQQVGIKMDLHRGESPCLVNTSSRVTNCFIGKIKLHIVVENSSPVSQEVQWTRVYSHISWAAKLHQAQGVKQKISLLLTPPQWAALDRCASDKTSAENDLPVFPIWSLNIPLGSSCHMQIKLETHQNRVKYFTWEQYITLGPCNKVAACRICCCYRRMFHRFLDTLLK